MEQHTQNTGNLAGALKGQDAPEALSTGEFPVQPAGKLTPREKRWIMYDVGNSAFVLLSTAVVPIYANSLLRPRDRTTSCPHGGTRRPWPRW